ncbi:MAG: choice-of-anchor B family protein [Acidimicrobiia bacterium]
MRIRVVVVAVAALMMSTISPVEAHEGQHPEGWHGNSRAEQLAQAFLADKQPNQTLAAASATSCVDGFAGIYPCSNVDLMAFLPLADIGGGSGNDIWGWTDPQSGREYALMGRSTGTSIVDISDPVNPVYLGNLPTSSIFSSSWRDIKVHADHAFIVSEASNHGMQVFDLTQLRNVTSPPVTFSETAHFSGFRTAHNVVINEDSGFAYAVGTNTCSGGLHMVNISNPTSPVDAGCYSGDGYTHDAQCVNYVGPDTDHQGKELCFASNEDTLTIVDVTDKTAPVLLSRTGYAGSEYTHQGWLTEDQRHFLLDDELDESNNGHNTRTYVFDLVDVDAPVLVGTHTAATAAIDHNQYVVGNHSFQANYRAGLRVLDITGVSTAALTEVAFFDIYLDNDAPEFNGAWSNYPFFASGIVVVSGIEQGLFVLAPNLSGADGAPAVTLLNPGEDDVISGSVTIQIDASDPEGGTLIVEWAADDGEFQTATLNGDSGFYEATWDTITGAEGGHTVTARATDTAGNSATDTNNVTVDNEPDPIVHVGDLDGSARSFSRGRWTATVSVLVHDEGEDSVPGATVTGSWSTGGSSSCETGADGRCTVSMSLRNKQSQTSFTVTEVALTGSVYDPGLNHDLDGDSGGTSITVVR